MDAINGHNYMKIIFASSLFQLHTGIAIVFYQENDLIFSCYAPQHLNGLVLFYIKLAKLHCPSDARGAFHKAFFQ